MDLTGFMFVFTCSLPRYEWTRENNKLAIHNQCHENKQTTNSGLSLLLRLCLRFSVWVATFLAVIPFFISDQLGSLRCVVVRACAYVCVDVHEPACAWRERGRVCRVAFCAEHAPISYRFQFIHSFLITYLFHL